METTSAERPSLSGATTDFMAKNWRDLIRPRTLEVERDSGVNYGKFTCEPLERGFGTTLGNALRRVLLSSLQGAAITHLKIEGALHEFTYHARRGRGRDRHHPQPQGGAASRRTTIEDLHGPHRQGRPRAR